ncbi:MAG: helix-turn-helix domain-containing protein [Pseudomonadota bacterium]
MERPDDHPSHPRLQTYEFALGDELRGERATKGKTLLDVQRDLRIQATYIAAIEDGNVQAFPNPSFIPGYVRSYARYLSLDAAEVYERFCHEHRFSYGGAGSTDSPPVDTSKRTAARLGAITRSKSSVAKPSFQPRFPLSEPRPGPFADLNVSALGSFFVLLLLLGGLGYGGWSVLQSIQRVQFAPVEDLPIAQSELASIQAPSADPATDGGLADLATPIAATSLFELYRQQELEVPILQPRDGPIAAIDPEAAGPLWIHVPEPVVPPADLPTPSALVSVAPLVEALYGGEDLIGPTLPAELFTEPDELSAVSIVVERAAWVRIYQENGTIVFERILERGESYEVPRGLDSPLIWAGNSGSVYVELDEKLFGPLGSGTRAVKDISLVPTALADEFSVVDNIPEVISQRALVGNDAGGGPLSIQ